MFPAHCRRIRHWRADTPTDSGSRRKCQILTQYGITLSDAGQDICQMQCCCSRGQRSGVPDADIRSDFFFKLVDIFP